MKTLLHTCCGPCASACVPRLQETGREVTMLFANSNIDTQAEFDKRFQEAEKLAKADGVKLVALPYDHEEWLREVAAGYENEPERGARCARCFRYNLSKTAAYAAERGYDEYTTSLTVSPHKDSKTIFSVADNLCQTSAKPSKPLPNFLPVDFKKRAGFKLSTRRAAELGLYRQSYCGCEFSHHPQPSTCAWRIHHKAETASTNLDARSGRHGDVYTADFQTAGRGRLDHKWLSPPGTNLMMSVVLSVADLPIETVSTLPLAIGLAVATALARLIPRSLSNYQRPTTNHPLLIQEGLTPLIKWPNDVLVGGKKLAGILCERQGDNVIVGIGVNVNQTAFAPEIADRATSLARLIPDSLVMSGSCGWERYDRAEQARGSGVLTVCQKAVGRDSGTSAISGVDTDVDVAVTPPDHLMEAVRTPLPRSWLPAHHPHRQDIANPFRVMWSILNEIDATYARWKTGFDAIYPEIKKIDCLKGRTLSVRQTDDDAAPIVGVSNGIMPDGSLDVGGVNVYAGEAHVEKVER